MCSPRRRFDRSTQKARFRRGANLIEATILVGLSAILVLIALRVFR